METLLFSTTALATVIGKDLIYTSLSTTTNALVSTFNYITKANKPGLDDFKNRMKDIDLYQTISLLGAFVNELETNNKEMPDSLHIALNGVDIILKEINKELEHVKDKIEQHNNLWFNSLRPTNFENSIKRMNKHYCTLEMRKTDLFEVAKYYKLR
jgi:hypothetical protein